VKPTTAGGGIVIRLGLRDRFVNGEADNDSEALYGVPQVVPADREVGEAAASV
jgi:hypothetical protein